MNKNTFILCILILLSLACTPLTGIPINRVVIWGHKLHTHTHSYVHFGFYKAFKAMGYETLWLDNDDDLTGINLENALFITEHQVDEKIPIRNDGYYLVYYSDSDRYDTLKQLKRHVGFKAYLHNLICSPTAKEVEPLIFYDLQRKELFMPWATDLLPEEIENNKQFSPLHKPKNTEKKIYYVGSICDGPGGNINEITPFIQACKDAGVQFIHSNPWTAPISMEDNLLRIQESYLAPSICGTVQLEDGYIPCRIFKNISYGHIGMTNSKDVYEFFKRKIVYNPNAYQLFFDGEKKLQEKNITELYELMDFIKEKHTYLNRAQHILNFFELLARSPLQ